MYLKHLLLLTFCLVCAAEDLICKKNSSLISDVINSLGARLINQIQDEGNYFVSPLSISVALAMVYVGTRGQTKDQMTSSLNYNIFGENCLLTTVGEKFRGLLLALEEENNAYTTLQSANGVFIHDGYNVSEYYKSNLSMFFDSDVEYLPFADEEMISLQTINEWVADHTRGKIAKLLNEPLDPMTIMVLINAIYFKGKWSHPFPKMSTWNSFFYGKNGTTKIIPFMLQQENLSFYRDPATNYSFLELEYIGGNVTMLLVLPKSTEEFPNFSLTSETLCDVRHKLKTTTVMAVIPKFRLEYTRELSKDMINLGMSKLFSDQADLTGIREQNDLHVSLMIHKTMIVVDESGSEASAISGVGIDGRMKTKQRASFWADHPFLFYIIHKPSDTILFAGRVSDP